MRFSTALFVASAGLVAAQTTTFGPPSTTPAAVPGTNCIGETTLQACLVTEKGKLDSCKTGDYICQCDNYKLIARCFDSAGCSSDIRKHEPDSQVTAFCAAASPLMSSTSANAPTGAASSSIAAASQSAQASISNAAAAATATKTVTTTQSHNAAAVLAAPVGGLAAFLLGVAGLL